MLAGCPLCDEGYGYPDGANGERWEAADALFHQDPRWLGADGASSIDLGGDRTLWLFGDSFIATSAALTRREATMVRNSVAVMSGRDPLTATMEFAWRDAATPGSFFPEAGDHWFWPSHGVRVPDGPLLLFLAEERPTPGQGLGFAAAGYRVVRVADPDQPPSTWTLETVATLPAPQDVDASVGACMVVDGDQLVAVSVDGDSTHDGRLVRWPLAEIAAGDASAPEWWSDGAWVAQPALVKNPTIVFDDAGSECSLSGDGWGGWTYVASRGFGASTIAVRSAPRLTDGWKLTAADAFTPPESAGDAPFVYAGKAHPELRSDGDHSAYSWDLVVTYADNSFTFADLLDPAREKTLYWPHFARIAFWYPAC